MDTYCTVSDCEEPTKEGRARCDMHEKRFQRKGEMHAPVERRTPKQKHTDAAIDLANAVTDEDYERLERAHDLAAKTWLRSIGWTPPSSRKKRAPTYNRPRG